MRRVLLQTTDLLWVEHLEQMDYLRSSVALRAYGQRDPLIEYKKEGLRLYKDLELSYRDHVLNFLPELREGMFAKRENTQTEEQHEKNTPLGQVEKMAGRAITASGGTQTIIHHKDTVGRNDPCPCGSGLKYKKCGLINAPEHAHASTQTKIGG